MRPSQQDEAPTTLKRSVNRRIRRVSILGGMCKCFCCKTNASAQLAIFESITMNAEGYRHMNAPFG